MKELLATVAALFCSAMMTAQNVSQFKVIDDSLFQNDDVYVKGNKYQRDAMLFVDMLADTHPYYVKKERRDLLFSDHDQLLKACAECTSDSAFVELLGGALGELRDKHTDVIASGQYEAKMKASKDKEQSVAIDNNSTSVMAYKGDLFHYTLIPKKSVCYLQFNKCMDARTMRNESLPRWDKTLDEMFAKMKEGNVKTLVVDAQYNNGGSSMLCDELLIRLCPLDQLKNYSSYMRFSRLMAAYNPRVGVAKKSWEEHGHIDELYQMPAGKKKPGFVQPEVFAGKVIFIQGEKTFSSAGILMTLARDNNIGVIVGTESTYSPSHYGEVLPFRLPNTGVLGSVSCKYFARPDAQHVDDKTLMPDVKIDLGDKDKAWEQILLLSQQ
ncbi:MAG: S41 family peptidase [Prevotella sp.]|nr:S41 family peptidase [Prevotella sp.]